MRIAEGVIAELQFSLGACPQTPIGERAALPKPLPQGIDGWSNRALRIAFVKISSFWGKVQRC
jgi:hypothetical protein